MNGSRTSKWSVGRQLAIGAATACVLSVGLAVPAYAIGDNAATSPGVINIANAGSLVISGTADSAVTLVTVSIDDSSNDLTTPILATIPLPGGAAQQSWSTAPLDVRTLDDDLLAITSTYNGELATLEDPLVPKDTQAPEAPTVSPDGADLVVAGTDILIESIEDQPRTHFTFGTPTAADPTATSPLVPAPPLASHTVSTTQQVKAITYDLAGNPSPIGLADFTVPNPDPSPGPGPGPAPAPDPDPAPAPAPAPVVSAVLAAPSVTVRTPAVLATGVSRVNNIRAKFNMGVTGVSSRSFTLRTKAGVAVPAVVTYNSLTRFATLNPVRTLAADTTYIATLGTGIKAGMALTLTRWSFTTGPRPIVTARAPGANASNVARAANVTIKFSENVVGVGRYSLTLLTPSGTRVAAVVSYNRTTRMATLNPSSRLSARTRYTVRLNSAIKDAAGNQLIATHWSFTTA